MIIGILGYIGAGKGTVSELLLANHKFGIDSFAHSLKDTCSNIFDWPRSLMEGDSKESREWRNKPDPWWSEKLQIENFTPRLAMQLLGTDTIRNHFNADIWLLTVENRFRKRPFKDVVISDVRFPNEIDLVRRLGGKLIQVKRGKDPVWAQVAMKANKFDEDATRDMYECFPHVHYSEWAWAGTQVDNILYNDGTINDLSKNLTLLIDKYKHENT